MFASSPEVFYDFKKLYRVTKVVTRNLNKIIDAGSYPLERVRNSTLRHRPIGIGVQGLADTFARLRLPYDSDAARQLNKEIFETIYFGACEASCELAEQHGAYTSFSSSPASQGRLQFDLWRDAGGGGDVTPSPRWNWPELKAKITCFGMRNSLLVAATPTGQTAHILGNSESFEPYTQNMNVCAGPGGKSFASVNRHLVVDLIERAD